MKKSLIGVILLSLIPMCVSATQPETVEAESTETPVEPISRIEFNTMQRQLFNKADKNFDGKVTYDETLAIQHEASKVHYESRFKGLDTNKNGSLSRGEVVAWHRDNIDKTNDRENNKNQTWFDRLDINKNGTVTQYEIDQYNEKTTVQNEEFLDSKVAKDFANKDLDENGWITLDEYIGSHQKARSKTLKSRGLSMLKRDTNGDGLILRSENETFIEQVFDNLDKNDDRKLSAEEQNALAFIQSKNISTHGGVYLRLDISGQMNEGQNTFTVNR